jgi:DivIVA domain-containing protein
MDSKPNAPSFTVSLRGYDREEVDEYLDSLAEALNQVEEAEAQTRRLQAHVAKCNARIKELEDRIRTDTPRTGIALGERIGQLLHQAEEAAAEALTRAETDASQIVAAADARAAEAEEVMRSATNRAEEQARRIETVARGEAAEIVAEAEARATARTRQIEQWAEQVVSHTRAEEARLYLEQQRARDLAVAELNALDDQRASAVATLAALRDALGQAVGLIEEEPGGTHARNGTGSNGHAAGATPLAQPSEPGTVFANPPGLSAAGAGAGAAVPTAENGGAEAVSAAAPEASQNPADASGTEPATEADQFEAKLDAWVSGGTNEN